MNEMNDTTKRRKPKPNVSTPLIYDLNDEQWQSLDAMNYHRSFPIEHSERLADPNIEFFVSIGYARLRSPSDWDEDMDEVFVTADGRQALTHHWKSVSHAE